MSLVAYFYENKSEEIKYGKMRTFINVFVSQTLDAYLHKQTSVITFLLSIYTSVLPNLIYEIKKFSAMNLYTLDPSKPESATAPVTATAPAPMPAPGFAPMSVAPPFYTPQHYPYYPYQYPQAPNAPPAPVAPSAEVRKIRDWLPWSIINLFIGGLLLGLLPLVFSIICRSNKKKNNAASAKTMSTLALVFNILVTAISIITAIAVFIYLFVYTQQLGSIYPNNGN